MEAISLKKSEKCAVCGLVRFYLLMAIPLVSLLGFNSVQSEGGRANAIWFARVELIDFLAIGSVIALSLIVAYRTYKEFWVPKKRLRALEELGRDLRNKDAG